MDSRSYTTISAMYNARWLAKALGLSYVNGLGGIDVAGEDQCIELKGRNRNWHPSWAVHTYQIGLFPKQNPKKELFWAFMMYDSKKTVPSTKNRDFPDVLTNRQVWLFDWNWVKQFPIHRPPTGPYIYVHRTDFPPNNTFRRSRKKGGVIFAPKNSSLEDLL